MLIVYLNYPNSRISAHSDSTCARIGVMNKDNQRTLNITANNVDEIMRQFRSQEIQFAPNRDFNDAWLYIDIDDSAEERRIIESIHGLLGSVYRPFANAIIEYHC